MTLPSKELLSEVLDINNCTPHQCDEERALLWFEYEKEDYATLWGTDSINIYELAHKCKEWAFKQGITLDSRYEGKCILRKGLHTLNPLFSYNKNREEVFVENTEPEVVFAVCQWILDNKESK